MQTVNIGILGLGRIGKIHLKNALSLDPQVRVMAVADIDSQNLEMAANAGIEYCHEDFMDVLNLPDLHAVLICTPTTTHYDILQAACNKGLHIFCEKPLDTDLARIGQIQQFAERSRVKVQVGFQRRFDPYFKGIHDQIRNGRIGDPHIVNITSRDPEPPPLDFVRNSGGLFMDMTIHDFDIARFLMQQGVSEVFAMGGVRIDQDIGRAGDIDTAICSLRFADDTFVSINNSRQAVYGYDQRVEVFGSKGSVEIFNKRPDNYLLHNSEGSHLPQPHYFFLERYADAYRIELSAFIDCLKNEELPVPAGISDAYEATAIALAANKSLKENRPVNLDEVRT